MLDEESIDPEDMSDEESIDPAEISKTVKRFYKQLDIRDLVIIVLMAAIIILYMLMSKDIANCNNYFMDVIQEMNNPMNLTQFMPLPSCS